MQQGGGLFVFPIRTVRGKTFIESIYGDFSHRRAGMSQSWSTSRNKFVSSRLCGGERLKVAADLKLDPELKTTGRSRGTRACGAVSLAQVMTESQGR